MRKREFGTYARLALLALLFAVGSTSAAMAATSSSNNYQVVETKFGPTSGQQSCSGEFCARATFGSIDGGKSASDNFSARFGQVIDGEPTLDVIIEPGKSNLGVLSADKTSTKTTIIKVRSYLSDGYVLKIKGDPPTYDGHTLFAPDAPTESNPGKEQFAINLANNTAPNIGAAPSQVPSADFSFGEAEASYDTPDKFMYQNSDIVAKSDKSSGRTDYTVSMIVNVSGDTPAGRYTSDFSAIVIPRY